MDTVSLYTRRKAPVHRSQEMAPIKQRAAFVSKTGVTFGLVDVPKPGPGQVLVKVVAAAQNPTDCQFQFAAFSPLPSKMLKNTLTSALRLLSDHIQGRLLDVHSGRPSMAESWVTILQASSRNLVPMFLRVFGLSAIVSRGSLL